MLLALALALAAAPIPAVATEASDARCLASISYLIGIAKEEQSKDLTIVAIYFAGKLYGRNPAIDLTATLKAIVAGASENDLRAEAPRCATELATAGEALQAAGTAISAMAKGN